MRRKLSIMLVTLFLFSFLSLNNSNVTAVHNAEFPTNGCANPTQTLHVGVVSGQLKFNVSKIEVAKGACLQVFFKNPDNVQHDFTVKCNTTLSNGTVQTIELIHMDTPSAMTVNHTWQMPNLDMKVPFFCEVPGHRAAGMVGDFILGTPTNSSSPGFEFSTMLLGFTALLVAIPVLRKIRN